jgi:hypothetical protein
MSKHETPVTEGFREAVAPGAFIPEYPLVRRTPRQSSRWADALILPNEENRRATPADYPSIKGHNVIVVQTKARRMGMYLMGQALFSARLAKAQGAATVRSVLLCNQPDSALLPLLVSFPEVEVWLCTAAHPWLFERAAST